MLKAIIFALKTGFLVELQMLKPDQFTITVRAKELDLSQQVVVSGALIHNETAFGSMIIELVSRLHAQIREG